MPEQNWVSMKEAVEITGIKRPNIYYYIGKGIIRTRLDPNGMARRQVVLDDLLAALGRTESNDDRL